MKLKHLRVFLVLLTCAVLALAPSLAEARAGNSQSQGSRGSRTHDSSTGAAPVQRSVTPQTTPRPSQPANAPRPAPTTPMGGGFFSQHPFMTGLMGGFLGAGLAGMLFGNSAHAADASPTGSMIGLLMQIALIGGLAYLAFRLFRRRSEPEPQMPQGSAYAATPAMGGPQPAGGAVAAGGAPVNVTDADYAAFGDLLTNIQGAWSKGDIGALRRYVTPEMLSYFSEELSRNASQGIQNRVEDVTLVKGDLLEAWREDGMEYATASLRFTARDFNVRIDNPSQVVGAAPPAQPVEATEVWTFVRSGGGHWLLSAIQQTN